MTIRSLLLTATRWGFSSRRRMSLNRTILAGAGIAAGVTALIVVLGVMGGLQKGYIESILEISSFHLRIELPESSAESVAASLRDFSEIASVVSFKETHVLAIGPSGQTVTLNLRSFKKGTETDDPALAGALGLSAGEKLPDGDRLILGKEAAAALGAETGSEIELFSMTQSQAEGIVPIKAKISVGGFFRSGYYEFDSGMGFVSMPAPGALQEAFSAAAVTLGVKLKDRYEDYRVKKKIETLLPVESSGILSWRDYNRSFFGALRTEKSVMMLLVSLIFVVVGINIFHAMRRTIAVKMADIAVLKALGASNSDIRRIFSSDGILVGAGGAAAGTALGLVLLANINQLLDVAATIVRAGAGLLRSIGIFSSSGDYRLFSPSYFYIEAIPVSISLAELIFIAFTAVASTAIAALLASRRVSEAKPSEVFRNE